MNYMNVTYVGGVLEFTSQFCAPCPTMGYNCDAPGNALESLRMRDGFTRAHNLSSFVRQCFNKKFCTPPSDLNLTLITDALALTSGPSSMCAANHTGPYCELCVEKFIMTPAGCQECTGDRALSFVGPILLIAFAIIAAIYLCRTGRAKALATFADSAFNKGRGTGSALDAAEAAAKDTAKEYVASRAQAMMGDLDDGGDNEEDDGVAKEAPEPKSTLSHQSPPASPPPHLAESYRLARSTEECPSAYQSCSSAIRMYAEGDRERTGQVSDPYLIDPGARPAWCRLFHSISRCVQRSSFRP